MSNWWRIYTLSLDYIGMRQSTNAAAGGDGRKEREKNRWIKSPPRIDLKSMSNHGETYLRGRRRSWPNEEKPTDGALAFDIRQK